MTSMSLRLRKRDGKGMSHVMNVVCFLHTIGRPIVWRSAQAEVASKASSEGNELFLFS
jgi:hypothetical protein